GDNTSQGSYRFRRATTSAGTKETTRFKVASRHLTQTGARAIDIAEITGYRDPSHFSRAFKRLAGCTPR
ncbi:MAG: AraC family transcriptional regulator, partial [Thermoanaerobaculia bacterium]